MGFSRDSMRVILRVLRFKVLGFRIWCSGFRVFRLKPTSWLNAKKAWNCA